MFNGKTISVVLTTYNGEKYIVEQLASILNQTCLPDEVLLCDDNSTDNTVGILRRFLEVHDAKNICNILVNPIALGFARNFLNGVCRSTGDYIFLSDQDDIWEPTKIQSMLQAMISRNCIESLSCGYTFIDSNGKAIRAKKTYRQKDGGELKRIDWLGFVKHPSGTPGMSLLITRELHERTMQFVPDKGEIPAHDWLYNEEAAKTGTFYKFNKPLVRYRQHGNNEVGILTRYNPDSLLKHRLYVLNSYIVKHRFLRKKYASVTEIENMMAKLLELDYLRCKNIASKKMLKTLMLLLKEHELLNAHTVLGDVMVMLKCSDTRMFGELADKARYI